MKNTDTKKQIIAELKSAGIHSAEIDAQILLEFVTKKSREFLLANPEFELSDAEIKKLDNLINQRKKHYPIAYITGHKEFFGLDFFVDKNVLIPRPETEQLVETALNFLQTTNHQLPTILDVGTGSGNIIISLAKNVSGNFSASENSTSALEVAKKNAAKHNVIIEFIMSDLFENITGKFDLIVANLPYVPANGSNDEEIKHEPESAIFANENGQEIIKRFLNEAKDHLNDDGLILLELDPRNAKSLATYAAKLFKNVEILKDYSDKDRFLKIF